MIIGKKVVLDVIDPSNLEWMREQRNSPEMRRYFREWKDISKDRQLNWYNERGNNTNERHVYWEIQNLGGNVIGCCGLHYIDWRLRAAEFSIFLCKETRGQGCGKEALELMFDFGFREMNLHKIWAEVYDNNEALNVYTKGLGMHEDGLLRDSYFCEGKYGNSTMLSVLEDEWFEKVGGR